MIFVSFFVVCLFMVSHEDEGTLKARSSDLVSLSFLVGVFIAFFLPSFNEPAGKKQ